MKRYVAFLNCTDYDPPRKKMIASGTKEFCETARKRYMEKHPGKWVGIEEKKTDGDPYKSQWPIGE